MKTVAQLVRKNPRPLMKDMEHPWPLPDNLMGIEVELEGITTSQGAPKFPRALALWDAHSDGSLVQGKEYSLRQPMSGTQLRYAIHELMSKGKFTRSPTGSTHIHMDMLEEAASTELLRTLVLLVYILEPMLYAAGDATREWCGFANRLRSGPDSLMANLLAEDDSEDHFLRNFTRDSTAYGRYYGLNLVALGDYGSLEYRYFPTATTEQELVDWVELVQATKKAAIAIGSRATLGRIMEEEELFMSMMQEHFGKWQHLFNSLTGFHEIRHNYRKACSSTYKHTARPVPRERFAPEEVFTEGRFAKFTIKLPNYSSVEIVWLTNDTVAPVASANNVNAFLIDINGRVYYNSGIGVGSSPSSPRFEWSAIPYTPLVASCLGGVTLGQRVEQLQMMLRTDVHTAHQGERLERALVLIQDVMQEQGYMPSNQTVLGIPQQEPTVQVTATENSSVADFEESNDFTAPEYNEEDDE